VLPAEVRANDDRVDDPGAVDDDTAVLAFLVAFLLAVLLTLALLALALALALPLALALTAALALPLALTLTLALIVLRKGAAQPTDPGDPEDHRDDVRQRALLCPLH
jgi:membrane protein implicated in regulation of membrane protease activity